MVIMTHGCALCPVPCRFMDVAAQGGQVAVEVALARRLVGSLSHGHGGQPSDGHRGQPSDGHGEQPSDGHRGQPSDPATLQGGHRGQPSDVHRGQPSDPGTPLQGGHRGQPSDSGTPLQGGHKGQPSDGHRGQPSDPGTLQGGHRGQLSDSGTPLQGGQPIGPSTPLKEPGVDQDDDGDRTTPFLDGWGGGAAHVLPEGGGAITHTLTSKLQQQQQHSQAAVGPPRPQLQQQGVGGPTKAACAMHVTEGEHSPLHFARPPAPATPVWDDGLVERVVVKLLGTYEFKGTAGPVVMVSHAGAWG